MTRRPVLLAVVLCAVAAAGYAYWKFAIPIHRVGVRSELVMLGDLDGDHLWTARDADFAAEIARDPWNPRFDEQVARLDLDRNGRIDDEDLGILAALVAAKGDAYAAHDAAVGHAAADGAFPRPRELYRYEAVGQYRARPAWCVRYAGAQDSVLTWLRELDPARADASYAGQIDAETWSEAVRFDLAWRRRAAALEPVEREYAAERIAHAEALFRAGRRFDLLLALIQLTEDAETLTTRGQRPITLKLLRLRDDLRGILASPAYADFAAGRADWRTVLAAIGKAVQDDVGVTYDLATIGPPRSLTHLENYLQRTEWQYYKTSAREQDFHALIDFAQNDPRYLRAVSRTSPAHHDPDVQNHNLPMVLLFREALRIEHGDKKKAVGLLDEAIRIPYGWIKSIPRERLPHAVALDNFLLPGNKEDGADKSRHWNVFGGICLYKSPEEALDLALKREAKDLRAGGYTEEAMREFLRDMIANLGGMYHVMSVDPGLLRR